MPRSLTISAATFLHFYIAANSEADHIRLFVHRNRVGFPAAHRSVWEWAYGPDARAISACTEHTNRCRGPTVHAVKSDRQRRAGAAHLSNRDQTMFQFDCCPAPIAPVPSWGSRPGTRSSIFYRKKSLRELKKIEQAWPRLNYRLVRGCPHCRAICAVGSLPQPVSGAVLSTAPGTFPRTSHYTFLQGVKKIVAPGRIWNPTGEDPDSEGDGSGKSGESDDRQGYGTETTPTRWRSRASTDGAPGKKTPFKTIRLLIGPASKSNPRDG